uniref:MADF domain-containing protein n=1 Tax=Caenorhabditis japonica TaxID=281687 RepID=A0A8R1EV97_CAEJA
MTDPVRAGKIAISGRENYEKLSTEQILKVIESIESHPLLWDMTDPAYKDTEKKNDCWWTLEKSLKFLKVEKGK